MFSSLFTFCSFFLFPERAPLLFFRSISYFKMRGSLTSSSSSTAGAVSSRAAAPATRRASAAPLTKTRRGPAPPRGAFGDLGDAAVAAGGISTAVVGLGALGLAGAALVATDPERR